MEFSGKEDIKKCTMPLEFHQQKEKIPFILRKQGIQILRCHKYQNVCRFLGEIGLRKTK